MIVLTGKSRTSAVKIFRWQISSRIRLLLSGEVWEKREYSVDYSELANTSVVYDSGDSNWFYREVCLVDSSFLQISATN